VFDGNSIMPSHFSAYVANLNRVGRAQLIDYCSLQEQIARARASLVANPLTGGAYGANISADTCVASRQRRNPNQS
jgi:hypothetical protein